MNPLLIGPLMDLAGKAFDKIFPDKEAAAKAKAEFAVQAASMDQKEIEGFRSFMLQYEGSASDTHQAIQLLRGSVRPLMTYFLAGVFAYGFINPNAINAETMQLLFNLNLLSLGFWFGERALKNLGLNLGKKHDA